MMRLFIFLLFITTGRFLEAQTPKKDIDHWLTNNLSAMGGRAVLLIYKNGKIIYENSANSISTQQKRIAKFIEKRKGTKLDLDNLTPNSKIAIASCSKWLTAALVMTFVEEKKLDLEDSIGKFLPIMTRNGKGNIKIWHCLSHLTGIKSPGIKEDLQEFRNFENMEEAINYIAGLPVEGVAGKTFRYSNIGLQLLAAVIEKISKQQFQDVFDDRIAQPLGMLHTDWGEGKIPLAAGGARSTASDYLQFTIMILNKGVYQQKKILQENSIAKMQVNRIDSSVAIMYSPAETGKWGYGFGEWVMKEASENKTSNGVSSPGLFGTFPWVDNTRNYSAVLLTLNLKNKNRLQLYTAVKALADKLVTTE